MQPILREHCIGCHGPAQQMNGFRLDRRSAALGGGTFPVLIPGSSATSRLYLKLLGPRFGQQMPPTGPLAPDQIDTIKRWLDEGAQWPDDLAGELPPAPPDPAAVRLMDALRRRDLAAARRQMTEDPAAARQRGPGGTTPLMCAALYADASLVQELLDRGADPNTTNELGSTALTWAVHDGEMTRLLLESWRERAMRGVGLAGGSTTVGYVLLGLGAERHPGDALTDAYAHYLASRQLADGRMRVAAHRPPQEASDITTTAVSIRGIGLYGGPATKAPVAAAARWLAGQTARSTEEAVFQLLGLAWGGQHADRVQTIGKTLLAAQRSDGGWSGLPALGSDAYATGQALVALREAGVIAASHPAYRRGVEFLLHTQLADGSWYVRSRSRPQQAYFESGFPHGADQFISAAATNWAALALLEALPDAPGWPRPVD